MKKQYRIEDWAGNIMNWGAFPTFEDAWSEIMRRIPNEDDQGEFYAEEI